MNRPQSSAWVFGIFFTTFFSSFLSIMLLGGCAGADTPREYQYQVLAEQPHDTGMFTQGLLISDGLFYESGGRYGQSRLIRYGDNGRNPQLSQALEDRYFAEGLTALDGTLYLLTWRENTLLMFDRDTLAPIGQQTYQGEGWGLTDDGEQLIRTDGSHHLFFHTLEGFEQTHRLTVTEEGEPVRRLNELEYIDGYIWANIWQSNRLVKIDPSDGQVVGTLDLSELTRKAAPPGSGSVLNGIAYDPEKDAIWVTGKNWPTLFLLKLE